MRFQFIVKQTTDLRKHDLRKRDLRRHLALLLVVAPAIAGCSGASDLMSKDAEWFSRPGRMFIRNISIDAPPLTPDKPVTPDDLVSAEGACPGMPPPGAPADANASAEATGAAAAAPTGAVALGHTECDVVRGIGAPSNVNISNSPNGDRVAVVTWSSGPRAGTYTFTAGRLTSVEGVPEPSSPAKPARKKAVKKKAAT